MRLIKLLVAIYRQVRALVVHLVWTSGEADTL